MKKLFFFFFFFFFFSFVSAATYDLKVASCTDGVPSACTAGELLDIQTDNASVTFVVDKSETGVTDTWEDPISSVSPTNVLMTFRHNGDGGISNSWSIPIRNEANTATHCTLSTTHVTTDTTITFNLSNSGVCTNNTWTEGDLTDLEVAFISGDAQGPTKAYVSFVKINFTYTPPNIYIDDLKPNTTQNFNQEETFLFNATVTCNGQTGASCGNVSIYPRYNLSLSTPDKIFNHSDNILEAYIYNDNFSTQLSTTEISNTPNFYSSVHSNGTHIWMPERSDDDMRVFEIGGSRVPSLEFDLAASGNDNPYGVTGNGTHLWTVDLTDDLAYEWKLDGTFITTHSLGFASPNSIYFNGTNFFVSNYTFIKVFDEDFNLLRTLDFTQTIKSAGSSQRVQGVVTNNKYIWVFNDRSPRYIYKYTMGFETIRENITSPFGVTSGFGFDDTNKRFLVYDSGTVDAEEWKNDFSEDYIYDMVAPNYINVSWLVKVVTGNVQTNLIDIIANSSYGNATIQENHTTNTQINLLGAAADNTAPTYSSINHNQTTFSQPTNFSVLWDDNQALHPNGGYIFTTNNTGQFVNDTFVSFSTTPSWANINKILNDTTDNVIAYGWYANDTAGNWNYTGLNYLTVTAADTCTYPGSGDWLIDCNDNCSITSTNALGNDVYITGYGFTTGVGNIFNYNKLRTTGENAALICRARY